MGDNKWFDKNWHWEMDVECLKVNGDSELEFDHVTDAIQPIIDDVNPNEFNLSSGNYR